MSLFPVPSLKTLVQRVQADYLGELGAIATVRRSFPYALARAQAGVAAGLYGLISKAVDELHPWTARTYGVVFWAAVFDVQRISAVPAVLSVTFEGDVGAVVAAGARLVRDDGAQFEVPGALTVGGGGTVTGAVAAVLAGAAGNCEAGTPLRLSTPIAGVATTATVISTTSVGADLETLSGLKGRYLQRMGRPPQGGATSDYEKWSKEVAGVDRVFVTERWAGNGTVLVRFTATGDDPVPSDALVAAVEAQVAPRRPVTAVVTVAKPATKAWTFIIELTAATGHALADVKSAVYAEIRTLFRSGAIPGGTVWLSSLDAAISRAEGEDHHAILTMNDGTGATDPADLTHDGDEIPVLEDGGITWA